MILIESKQLTESWLKRQLEDVSTRQTPAGLVWVVRYKNPVVTDKTEQTLYIFFDEFGNYMEANLSGRI